MGMHLHFLLELFKCGNGTTTVMSSTDSVNFIIQ